MSALVLTTKNENIVEVVEIFDSEKSLWISVILVHEWSIREHFLSLVKYTAKNIEKISCHLNMKQNYIKIHLDYNIVQFDSSTLGLIMVSL